MTAEEAIGPNIAAMKLESLEVSTSTMEEEFVEEEEGADEVEAMGFVEEEFFLASRRALILFAYSQVSGRLEASIVMCSLDWNGFRHLKHPKQPLMISISRGVSFGGCEDKEPAF